MKKLMLSKKLFKYAAASVFGAAIAGTALASGFQLFEQNGTSVSDFGAGAAAEADDASTAFTNPAGMVRLKHPEVLGSVIGIYTDLKFDGTAVWTSTNPRFRGARFVQTGTAQGGGPTYVPSFHFVTPIDDRISFGFSVISPFGLVTDYPFSSVVRYAGTKSSLKVVDISPALALKINKYWSVGAGLDAQFADAKFDSVAGIPVLFGPAADTLSANAGDAWGYGFHVGLLFQPTQNLRFGVTYHSSTAFRLKGKSTLSGPIAAIATFGRTNLLLSRGLTASLRLPAWVQFSAYDQLNYHWAVMGSVIYTRWSSNTVLVLRNVAGVGLFGPAFTTVVSPQDYHNTWRFVVGAHYRIDDKWMIRGGLGYDQTPTTIRARSIRLPDGRRYALSLGVDYQATKALGVTVGWTHLFVSKGRLAAPSVTGTQVATLIGRVRNNADLLGAQVTYKFL